MCVCTRFGEDRRYIVGVNGAKGHDLIRLTALNDGHTDQWVVMLRDHQHLKHLQWTRDCEVYNLRTRTHTHSKKNKN